MKKIIYLIFISFTFLGWLDGYAQENPPTYSASVSYYLSRGCLGYTTWTFEGDGNAIGTESLSCTYSSCVGEGRGSVDYDAIPAYDNFSMEFRASCLYSDREDRCERDDTRRASAGDLIRNPRRTLGNSGCSGRVDITSFRPNLSIRNSSNTICIGGSLDLQALPDGFPDEAYNWQYSTNNGTTWQNTSADDSGERILRSSIAEILGNNHLDFVGENILFRLGIGSRGFSAAQEITYSACAPLVTSLSYTSPECPGDLPDVTIRFNRGLNIPEERFSTISIINVNDSSDIPDQETDATMRENTYVFRNVARLKDDVRYRIRYQMQRNGVLVPGFITSNRYFVHQNKNPITFNSSHTNISCASGQGNDSNGVVRIYNIGGGTGSYQYNRNNTGWRSFSGNSVNIPIPNDALNYNIQIQDRNECIATTRATGTITRPNNPIEISGEVRHVTAPSTNNGAITISVRGGNGGYTYNWTGPNGYRSGLQNIFNLAVGEYTVGVTDGRDCLTSRSFTINRFTFRDVTYADVTCGNNITSDDDGYLEVRIGGGTPNYTYILQRDTNGTFNEVDRALSASSVFERIDLEAGSYRLVVQDANGLTIERTFEIESPPDFDFSIESSTDVLCTGAATGKIDLEIEGGATPYTISWEGNGETYTTEDLENIPAGLYTLTLTDRYGCSPINTNNTVLINEPPSALTANITDGGLQVPTFPGATNGSITIEVSGGVGPYTYQWTKNDNTTFSATTQNISDLSDGVYNVTVTDDNDCFTQITDIELREPDPLLVTISLVDAIRCHQGLGSISANATGGITTPTNGYEFSWFYSSDNTNFQPITPVTQTITDLVSGWYQVMVSDNNDIQNRSTAFYLEDKPALVITSIQENNITCFGGNDGAITIDASGGTGTLRYSIDNGDSFSNSNSFTELTAATYQVIVRDENNCDTQVNTISLVQPDDPITISSVSNDVTIFGLNSGSIELTVSGGNSGYTYQWIGPNGYTASSQNIANLFAGDYTVTIYDNQYNQTTANEGCSLVETFTITEPDQLTVTVDYETDDSYLHCHGDDDARLLATVNGGVEDYSFEWQKESSNIFVPLADTSSLLLGADVGVYRVIVTDAAGAVTNTVFTLTQPDPIAYTYTTTEVDCFGNATGSIDLEVTGGTAPYTFIWSNNQTVEDADNLVAGNYRVTITDAEGCELSSDAIMITQPSEPLSEASSTITDLSGFETNNGAITVVIEGGTPPYQYAWKSEGSVTILGTDATIENLSMGAYELTVTDANDCIFSEVYQVNQPNLLEISSITADSEILCFGDETVTLTATVIGGVTPYTYRWFNEELPSTTLGTLEAINDLGAGTYILEVTDANNNQTTNSYTIDQNDALAITLEIGNVSCFGGNDGSISLGVTGGTGNYQFFWDHGSTDQNPTNLRAGNYAVTIQDSNLCSLRRENILIEQPENPITLQNSIETPPSGFGLTNGSIEVTITGGTVPYSYRWENEQGQDIGDNSSIIQNIGVGTYTLQVTDANDCILEDQSFTLGQPDLLEVSIVATAVLCNSGTGTLTAEPSGGVPPYTYQWLDENNEIVGTNVLLENVLTGNYTVQLTDANANNATANYFLSEPTLLQIVGIQVDPVSCYNGDDGRISITVEGGIGSYRYQWSNGVTDSSTLTNITTGSYQVTVYDENDCSVLSEAIVVSEPTRYAITNVDLIRPSGTGTNDGQITTTHIGGVSPFTFVWIDQTETILSNETSTSLVSSLSNISEGVYTLTITDSDGCLIQENFNLANPGELLVEIQQIQEISCFGGSNGRLTVITTGGVGGNTYEWYREGGDLISTTPNLNDVNAGNYYVVVSNAEGIREQSALFAVEQPEPVIANLSFQNPLCFEAEDGSITLEVTGGNGNYEYRYRVRNGSYSNWTAFEDANTTEINNLQDNLYDVQVKDSNGCNYEDNGSPITMTQRLIQPTEIQITNVTLLNPTGFGLANGSIELTVNGGTPPYRLEWYKDNVLLSESSENITGLDAGNYSVIIRDTQECSLAESFILTQPDLLEVAIEILNPIACHDTQNANLQAIVSGGIEDTYIFDWYLTDDPTNIIGSGNVLENVGAGSYTVRVRDLENNEAESAPVILVAPDPLQVSLIADHILCGDQDDWSIETMVTGGTPPYTYFWNNNLANTPNVLDIPQGIYEVTVTDSRGCQIQQDITLVPPASISIDAIITNPTCFEGDDGQIQLTTTGGTPPYTFLWNDDIETENREGLSQGIYMVEVIDSKGCTFIESFELNDPEELVIDLGPDKTLCLDQIYTIDASIDDPLASYRWEGSQGFEALTSSVTVEESGVYTVYVTTGLGCISTDSIEITALETPIHSELVVATDLFVNESFAIVNVSNPLPDNVEWVLPETIQIIEEENGYVEVLFSEEGTYEVGLRTFIGDCESLYTKTISVRQASFDRDRNLRSRLQNYLMYPNPSKGNFTIELEFESETPIDFKLFNVADNSIKYEYSQSDAKTYTIPFNLEGQLPSGIYFLLLETPEKSYIRKIMIE